MSVDGTYGIVYSGVAGVGMGVFTILDNVIKGTDLFDTRYSGTFSKRPNANCYDLVLDLRIPPGVLLVQGTAPQEVAHKRASVTLHLPLDFYNGEPIKQMVGPGQVTFMIRPAPDD